MKHLEHTPDFICEQGKTNYCAYVDTDSNYINAKPLLEYLWDDYKTLPNNVKDHNAEQVAFAFEKEINEYYKDLAADCFNVPKDQEHYLEMKTECVIRSAYFRATRRYAQWITKQEGIKKDILDIKGLEFMKANFPPIFGEFFNNILQQVLKGGNKEDIIKQIRVFKKKINDGKIPIIQLGNPTSVKKLDNYVGIKPRAGELLLKLKKELPLQ